MHWVTPPWRSSKPTLDNRDQALESARQAIAIEPRPAITNAMVSLVLMNSGMPSQAIDVLNEAIEMNPQEPRTPYLNLLGIARYLSGDHDGALGEFEDNRSRNGPWGPHMDVFQAAAYAEGGNEFRARAVIENLQAKHPDYPVEAWLAFYIPEPAELAELMERLRSFGLNDS